MTTPHLHLVTHNVSPSLRHGQSPIVTTSERQGHKLLDKLSPYSGDHFLKLEDLKQTLKDTPEDKNRVAGQIRNLQDLYRDGWQHCQEALNKMGKG